MKEPAVQANQEGAGVKEDKGKELSVVDPIEQQPIKCAPLEGPESSNQAGNIGLSGKVPYCF
jgi:hypothetical protein